MSTSSARSTCWVRFTAPFNWSPPERRQSEIAYPAGLQRRVRRDCAAAAVKAGKAVRVRSPANREQADAALRGEILLEAR